MGGNSKIEIHYSLLRTSLYQVFTINYIILILILMVRSLNGAIHFRNFSGRVHCVALIDQKFMSEYKGRSRFVLGNI